MEDTAERVIENKGSGLTIRRLQKEDKEILWEYFNALSGKSKYLFRPHNFDKETAEKLCQENDPSILRFIAIEEINGKTKVIGYTFLQNLRDDFPSLGIGIRDDYQGKGYGKILMDHLISTAKSLGKKGLRLTVYGDNEKGLGLYKRFGFQIEKVTYSMKLEF